MGKDRVVKVWRQIGKNRKLQSAHKDLIIDREEIIVPVKLAIVLQELDGCSVCLGEHFPLRSQLDVSWCTQECQSANRTVTEHRGEHSSFCLSQWTASAAAAAAAVVGVSLFYPHQSCLSLGLFPQTNSPVSLDPIQSKAAIVVLKHKLLHIQPLRCQTLEHGQSSINNGP